MTDIVVTAAQVGRVQPDKDEVYQVQLAATVTAGQVLYQNSSGTFDLADANGSGTIQARGIALEGGAAGAWIPMMKRGQVYGFTVSSLDGDALLYLSVTAGALADATGGTNVVCGLVMPAPDTTKIVYVDFDWTNVWA